MTARRPARPRTRPFVGDDPIDIAMGARIREARVRLGITQQTLAAALRVTFQQIQKYERGTNRVSVPMLVRMAPVLQTTPAALIDGIGSAPPAPAVVDDGRATDRETLEAARAIAGVKDARLRRKLRQLAAAIAGVEEARAA